MNRRTTPPPAAAAKKTAGRGRLSGAGGRVLRTASVFAAATAVALAVILGGANLLGGRIEQNRAAYQAALLNSLLANAPHDAVTKTAATAKLPAVQVLGVMAVWQGGKVAAAVVEATATDGYNGEIKFLLAVKREQKTTLPALRVIAHRETPGIADFLTTDAAKVFDGVAGATISADALTRAAAEAQQWTTQCFNWQTGRADC